jgi:CheY-like chemotaxis protein
MTIESLTLKPEELVLLYVEDDLLSRKLGLFWLNNLFKEVMVAVDGAEGLRKYFENEPDLILTDQMMPEISGLDMVRTIRADGHKTPVILMTSSIDNQVLVDAINLGVTRFIPKPFDSRVLASLLNDISRQVVSERLFEKHRKQEMELLRYRDNYNSIQQEAAQNKERHVVRHDLRNQCLTDAGRIRWGVEVVHSPRDIMSGDGYTVRQLPDNRLLIFVVDAMGSGLSASISSLLATSFCNYLMEHLLQSCHCSFEFRYFLTLFKQYLSGMLMEEEAISCGFFLVDLNMMKTDLALFALPPLLVFLADLRRDPTAVLHHAGRRDPCRATIVPNPEGHRRIRALLRAGYGWRDRWVGWLTDTSASRAIRLDCDGGV